MYEKPIICLLLIWHVPGPLKTFIGTFMRVCLCVCQNEGECMRERERERVRAIRVLLIHSIFVVAFILLFLLSLLYVQYTYSGIVTKLRSSAGTGIEMLSG